MQKALFVFGTAAILCAATVLAQESQRSSGTTQRSAAPGQSGTAGQTAQNYLWASVMDAETQKPLAGVKATLHFAKPNGKDVDTRTTQSDDQGRIFFPLPSELNANEDARTNILVEKEGYVSENIGCQTQWAERSLKEGNTVCAVFPLQKAEQITGRFVDEQGNPLANTLIAVLRQKVSPYGNEGADCTESWECKCDSDGRFSFNAAKNERIAFWATPEKLAPQFVFPNQKRGDLGNITVEKGFEPVVTVQDKDGKPVQNVWVNLNRRDENYGMAIMSAYSRSALTDQNGQARFRPVSQGDYEVRVSERPSERLYSPWSIASSVTCRAIQAENQRPVKGTYVITPVQLSATSPQMTLQAQNTVNVDVQFSDRANNPYRELNTNIYGRMSNGSYFVARSHSDSPSAYRGNGLFSFQVPVGLENTSLRIPSDTNTAYRARIDSKGDWLEANNSMQSASQNGIVQTSFQSPAGQQNVSLIPSDTNTAHQAKIDDRGDWLESNNCMQFSLGTIEQAMTIDVAAYRSPKITLNVVNESGQPIKEYYAWMEYAKHGTPAKVSVNGDQIRVDAASGHQHTFNWDSATSELPLVGTCHCCMDVSFKYRNFGRDETRINAEGILPNEAMNLYVVGKGYSVQTQAIPKMAEGEERNLTITLKK